MNISPLSDPQVKLEAYDDTDLFLDTQVKVEEENMGTKPVLQSRAKRERKPTYSQDQKDELILSIINDKVSVEAASARANIYLSTVKTYVRNYFKENPSIPVPGHIGIKKSYAQEQVDEVIGYIVDDDMSIAAASKKVNMNQYSAEDYYRQYLNDNNMEALESKKRKYHTQVQINKFIDYFVQDNMSLRAASKKANISHPAGKNYRDKYLMSHDLSKTAGRTFTDDQIASFTSDCASGGMTIEAASKKANMSRSTRYKCYNQYRNDKSSDVPT